MLPDQAHVRSEDWTIFFLHKDTTEEDEAREEAREEKARLKEERLLVRQKAIAEGRDDPGVLEDEEDDDEEDQLLSSEGYVDIAEGEYASDVEYELKHLKAVEQSEQLPEPSGEGSHRSEDFENELDYADDDLEYAEDDLEYADD